jgi:hypothetical protein
MLTVEQFRDAYPDIATPLTDAVIQTTIDEIEILYNDFCNMSEPKKLLGYKLLTAHILLLRNNSYFIGGAIKSIRNENDAISYHGSVINPFDYHATHYGSMFYELLLSNYKGGFAGSGNDCCPPD